MGQIIAPVFIVTILFGFQLLANAVLGRVTEYPPDHHLGNLTPCIPANSSTTCATVLYYPNVPWVVTLLQEVARRSFLDFNSTFVLWQPSRPPLPLPDWAKYYYYYYDMMKYLGNNQNTTKIAMLFKSAFNADWRGDVMPPDPGYNIWYNSTAKVDGIEQSDVHQTVKAISESILALKSGMDVHFNISTRDYPSIFRINAIDIIATNGATWFFVPPMVTFFIVLTEIVYEKESRLRLGMKMMGLANTPYWITWWLYGVSLITLSTLMLMATGYAFQIDYFMGTNPVCIFLLFFIFGMAITAFSMFLSSLIQKSGTAQTVGYALVLLGFVFQVILSLGNGILVDMLWSVTAQPWVVMLRWILTIYPPFNMAKVFNAIGNKASPTINFINGTVDYPSGFHWDDLFSKHNYTLPRLQIQIVSPAPAETLGWMALSTIFFLILMLYFDNVLPGEHGSPKSPIFFLLPSYWCGTGHTPNLNPEQPASFVNLEGFQDTGDGVVAEKMAASDLQRDYPIRIRNISKTYTTAFCGKDVVAVNDVSLVGDSDSIVCLLGHNGAGKTSLVNMLTGLFEQTSGTAEICGMDINSRMDEIQQILGVCPQHDILWSELTAREHLELFSELKGVPEHQAQREIQSILQTVGLDHVADDRVSSFSGGMKRRLSIGISTIGNPRVIFMDEPTTGLDPVNRKKVWHMIQRLKIGRAVVLTTHSMQEADVLADKVAIMTYGEICCVGSTLHLKNKYGGGYHVDLVCDKTKTNSLIHQLTKQWPGVLVTGSVGENLQLTIPFDLREEIPNVLGWFEEACKNQALHEWGLSHASLEEVFLKVTRDHAFGYPEIDVEEDEEPGSAVAAAAGSDARVQMEETAATPTPPPSPPETYPLRALFRKNLVLQRRQTCANVCQVLTPIVVLLCLIILQVILKAQLGDDYNKRFLVNVTQPVSLNDPIAISQLYDNLLYVKEHLSPPPLSPHNENHYWKKGACLKWYMFTDHLAAPSTAAGSLNVDGFNNSGLLGEIPQGQCIERVSEHKSRHVHVPYMEKKNNSLQIQKLVINITREYNSQALKLVREGELSFKMPDGYVEFKNIDPKKYVLDVLLSSNTNPILSYHRENNISRVTLLVDPKVSNSFLDDQRLAILPGFVQLTDLVTRAFSNHSLKLNNLTRDAYNWMDDNLDSARFIQAMPFEMSADLMMLLDALGSSLYPIALTLQLPVYTFLLVLEKKQKLREMMKVHGMKKWQYYFVNYVFFMCLYIFSIIFFWISGYIADFRFFSHTSPDTLALFFFGWGMCLVSLAFFISSLISDPRAATVTGYAFALVGTLTALVICLFVYGPLPWSLPEKMPSWTFIWPQFAFVRGIYLLNSACSKNFRCYGPLTSFFSLNDEFSIAVIALLVGGVVYFFLFLYLDAVIPQEFGIPESPLLCLKCETKPNALDEEEDSADFFGDSESPDVGMMKEKIKQNTWGDEDQGGGEIPPLLIDGLRKVYDNGKVAVSNLNIYAEKNTCFGLLGENGAGKTTTISIMTGLFPPTSGTAFVGGYQITNQIDEVHLVTGLCPQFDVLWDDLTPCEHLLFYARLKGIPSDQEDEHVDSILIEVGLHAARDRASGKLSGGMKRRLQLAIAMVGNSRVIFLDEPTTGLDPTSRRQIWSIIDRAKKGRAIILTTHGMDEAEALCDVIGIMAHGKMRCVGSSQHLRSSSGTGYALTIAFAPHDKNRALEFILSVVPSAQIESEFRGTIEFRISEPISVSKVFATVEAHGASHGITCWGINQLGLETVFQEVVRAAQKGRPQGKQDILTIN